MITEKGVKFIFSVSLNKIYWMENTANDSVRENILESENVA